MKQFKFMSLLVILLCMTGHSSFANDSKQHLTFVANESGTFSFSGTISNTIDNSEIYYSLDSGVTWSPLVRNSQSPTIQAGKKIMFKGSCTPFYYYVEGSEAVIGIGVFSSTGRFDVEGNIMSLLYGDNFNGRTDLTGKDYTFYDLFSNCTGLISADNLVLPATTLADNCYEGMFRNCTSMTAAPKLPATSLAKSCYSGMFYGCTTLTVAPQLPATTLDTNCYCYMFGNCTSLTIAPKLPAMTLTDQCYRYMFDGCTNLKEITCLATNISASDCTSKWVRNVSLTGTFTKSSNMNSWTVGADGIPANWNIQNANESSVDDSTSGKCGETVNYTYDKASHTLSISGKGAIYDYDNVSNKAPWFSYASGIQKIEIESGITSIGYFAFYKCSSITSLSIPATVGYIGSSAFEGCTSLTSLELNEGLLYIGGSAFEGCAGLQTLTIPSTVNTISINAFKNCKGITDVYCYAETIPETHSDAFVGTPTESATLYVPANVVETYKTTWPWSNFKNIVAIGTVPIDDSTISGKCGENVYYTYDKTTHILTISGEGAMQDYEYGNPWPDSFSWEIQSSIIEYGVTSIGKNAFNGCSALTSIIIPNSVTSIGDQAFRGCGLTSVDIPNSVTHIGEWAFCAGGLTSVTIPSSITVLPYSIFNGCSKLTSVTIPDNITSIGGKAFYRCKGLTSVTIGNDVRSIGDWAFGECVNLSTVNIPNSVTSIGLSAFNGCNKLNIITSEIQNPFAIDINVFCTYYTATLIVPKGTISAYESTEGWKNFFNIIDDPSNIPSAIDNPIVINTPIIGKWALDPGGSNIYINLEFKSDGTFIYTDSEEQTEKIGNYVISGDILCRRMGNEEVWIKSKIWRLDAISLVFQDYGDMDNSLRRDIYVYFNENPEPAKDPNPLLVGMWDYMWSSPFKSFILTNVEFKADGTFCYTSVNDPYYKDYGVYRVEGDMLYEMYDIEGDWEMSKIKTLESNYLVIAEIGSDGLSEKHEIFFHRNNIGERNATLTGSWLGCTVSDRQNRFEQWTFNNDKTGLMTTWREGKDNISSDLFTYTATESSITIDWSDGSPEVYQYSIYGSTLTLIKGSKSKLYYKQGEETGIRPVASKNEIDCIYSLKGVKIKNPSKGINIIKMKDGTVKKVLIK